MNCHVARAASECAVRVLWKQFSEFIFIQHLVYLCIIGSGLCPECQIPLRRQAFRIQLFEDPAVEKEVDIRRRILRDYCKTETDFGTLLEFNDYLEEVIYN